MRKTPRLPTPHGFGRKYPREFGIWGTMISRCHNPSCTSYEYYGARGIRVCKRWMLFSNFMKDMGVRPTPEHSIDRINVRLGYFKKNCRWATRQEQAYNKRNTQMIEYRGERMTLRELSRRSDLPWKLVYSRLYGSQMSVEEAVSRPVDPKRAIAAANRARKLPLDNPTII